MIKLIINKKKYKYRSKQSEITYRIGRELELLKEEYPCDCNPEFHKWILTILCGCTFEIADLVTEEQLARLIGVHPYFANDIKVALPRYIKINHKLHEYQTFENITVLEYSELDMLSSDGENLELFKRLYKPINWKLKNWWKYLLIKNKKSYEDCNYFVIRLAINQHYWWKRNLMLEYKLTYDNPNIAIEDQPDEVKLTPVEKFGMYHIVMQICGNDIEKFHWWQDREVRELFKYLLYLKMKQASE